MPNDEQAVFRIYYIVEHEYGKSKLKPEYRERCECRTTKKEARHWHSVKVVAWWKKKRINDVDALNYVLLFGELNLPQCKKPWCVSDETLLAKYIFHKLSLLWRNICNHNINVSAFSTITVDVCSILSSQKQYDRTSSFSIVRNNFSQKSWFTPWNLSN